MHLILIDCLSWITVVPPDGEPSNDVSHIHNIIEYLDYTRDSNQTTNLVDESRSTQ